MPQQVTLSVENNFTKGLITEATGLNFPENAATDCDNCTFTLVGDVTRRLGINFEPHTVPNGSSGNTIQAQSTYTWNNPGGDGNVKLLVRQQGKYLYFYTISNVTTSTSLSANILPTIVDMSFFGSGPSIIDTTVECTYADGNGYLFVYNSSANPFYVTYNAGTITAAGIPVNIRDFAGVNDNLQITTRPANTTVEHSYNLQNQGWISGNPWQASSTTPYTLGTTGGASFTVASGISGIVAGQTVNIIYNGPSGIAFGLPLNGTVIASGTVSAYGGTSLSLNITSATSQYFGTTSGPWSIVPISLGFINTFLSAAGLYPSNADVWWYFKDNLGAFNPASTLANVSYSSGLAPRGHYIMNAFYLDRSVASGLSGITPVYTWTRPSCGAWYQGRVWFAGCNANFPAAGDANWYTWSENIYFSQIVQTPADFGNCYQVNDPTSEDLNGLLPTDGGVIKIAETGKIHKLFPIANGMLVFANNGIWFITGSQGIGFAANDYTVTQISHVKILSPYNIVDVLGLPFFWNEEGIYQVSQGNNGQIQVEPITVGTILTYYNEIPIGSKFYARGDYDPVNYTIQWAYKSVPEIGIVDRYNFDKILNYNTYNKAFYPYTVSQGGAFGQYINGVRYVSYPNVTQSTPEPSFLYPTTYAASGAIQLVFSKEYDTNYVDWGGLTYDSHFVTGFKVRGQGVKKFQPQYIIIYNRTGDAQAAFKIQGLWDYGNNRNSGKWSSIQRIEIPPDNNFDTVFKRYKIRGHGYVMQFKVTSSNNMPFDIIGWGVLDTVNAGT